MIVHGKTRFLCDKLYLWRFGAMKAASALTFPELVEAQDRSPKDAAEEARFAWWRGLA